MPLPHLGDCTHDGQPVAHSHAAIASRVAPSQRRSRAEAAFGEAGAARVAVVDEDVAAPVSGCRAVDTPPMSQRSQVATSGSSPIEACSAACAAPARRRRRRRATPARGAAVHHTAVVRSVPCRQVERLLAEHLAGEVGRRRKATTWP